MAKSSRGMSEHERAERRRQDRERLHQAAEQLLSSEGWARWVRVRAAFHRYSAGNCMLIALQCHEREIVPEHVAGFRTWLKLGRCVRKHEKALRILAPISVKERDTTGTETGERRVFFKTAAVFELSQTEPLPGVQPVALAPPHQPLTGDSHAHLLDPLRAFAQTLGYTVALEVIPGSTGGWCDRKDKRIVVDSSAPGNAQLQTLIHETAHALGVDYEHYTREQAEVIVDTVTYCVTTLPHHPAPTRRARPRSPQQPHPGGRTRAIVHGHYPRMIEGCRPSWRRDVTLLVYAPT